MENNVKKSLVTKFLVASLCFAFLNVPQIQAEEKTETPFGKPAQKAKPLPPVQLPKKFVMPKNKHDLLDMVADNEWMQDPFKHLQVDMKSIVGDFEEGVTNPPATVTQPRVLSRLDHLIVMLEKKCKKSGSGSAPAFATKGANASTLKKGPGGQGKMRAADRKGRDWAKLTPEQRDKILQSKTEGFPAGYDDILADYFRRLAKNKPVKSSESNDVSNP